MTWQTLIVPTSPVWAGVEQYADERIGVLTQQCVDPQSTELQIRQAQFGIEEMRKLLAVPGQIKATTAIKQNASTRKEY